MQKVWTQLAVFLSSVGSSAKENGTQLPWKGQAVVVAGCTISLADYYSGIHHCKMKTGPTRTIYPVRYQDDGGARANPRRGQATADLSPDYEG